MSNINQTQPFQKIFNRQIDWCKFIEKQNRGDIIANFIFHRLTKRNDPFCRCPVKKGKYVSKINEVFDVSDLPMSQHILGSRELFLKIFVYSFIFHTKERKKMVLVFNSTSFVRMKKV